MPHFSTFNVKMCKVEKHVLWVLLIAISNHQTWAQYNERPCSTQGGRCLSESRSSCLNGRFVSQMCPTQSRDIRCCLPFNDGIASGPVNSIQPTCAGLGGSCGNAMQCQGLSVAGLCGSGPNRCCVLGLGANDVDKHLNVVEGFIHLTGYIPSAGSGVTIGTGVDLGQQSEAGLQRILERVNPDIGRILVARFRPYLNLRTRSAVVAAGLSASNLRITFPEARVLDNAFKLDVLNRLRRFIQNNRLTDRGIGALASLAHYCYLPVREVEDNKCFIRDCQNYLKLTLEHGGANDNALAEALENLAKCGNKKVTNGVVNRLQREAQFIRTGNSFLG